MLEVPAVWRVDSSSMPALSWAQCRERLHASSWHWWAQLQQKPCWRPAKIQQKPPLKLDWRGGSCPNIHVIETFETRMELAKHSQKVIGKTRFHNSFEILKHSHHFAQLFWSHFPFPNLRFDGTLVASSSCTLLQLPQSFFTALHGHLHHGHDLSQWMPRL